METSLHDLNRVLGVIGSFVCAPDGSILEQAVPEHVEANGVALAARAASQTLNALEASGVRANELDLAFADGRLIIKNLRGRILAILCARNTNLPLLNMTANAVVRKLTAESKSGTRGTALTPAPIPAPATAPAQPAPASAPAPSQLLEELQQEACRLIQEGSRRELHLRVMDDIGLWLACPNHRALLTPPESKQIELAGLVSETRGIQALFERLGFETNPWANTFYGNRRLTFGEPEREIIVEIFLDTFEMYHRFGLASFLTQTDLALPVTALLLTRLQVVMTNDKTLRELCALLLEYDLGVMEKEKLDAAFVASLCAEDWGWFKTVTLHLDRLTKFAAANLVLADSNVVTERAKRLRASIDSAPKGLRWQTRARLGETVKWYDTPQVF